MRRILIIAMAALLTASAAPGLTAQDPHDLFQQALVKEQAEGDLRGAIGLYEQIVERFADRRVVAARALLRLGECYEKLGSAEAQRAYRRLVQEFADQTELVDRARERLAVLDRVARVVANGPTFEKVRIPSRPQGGVLSPSGDSLAFVADGSLWVVPLHSDLGPDVPGEPVILAERIGAWDLGTQLSWSANGKLIAVNSESENGGPDVVHIVPTDGGDPRVVPLPPRGGLAWSYRVGLSPDGRELAFSGVPPDVEDASAGDHNVYVMPTDGGEPRLLAARWSWMPSFSPDGEHVAFIRNRERDDWPETGGRSRYDSDLWLVPTAGGAPTRLVTVDGRLGGPVWSPDGRHIAARYMGAGDAECREIRVYPIDADRSAAGEPIRVALPRSSLDVVAGWTPDDRLGVFMPSEAHDAIYTVPASGGRAVQVSPETEWPLHPRWTADGRSIVFRWVVDDEERAPVIFGSIPSTGGEIDELPVPSERPLISRVPGAGFSVSPDGGRLVVAAYQHPYDEQEGVDLWVIPLDGNGVPTRLTHDPSFEGYPVWSADGEWVVFLDGWDRYGDDDWYFALFRVPAHGGEPEQLTTRADSVDQGPIAVSPDGRRIAFLSNGAIKTIPAEGGEARALLENVDAGSHSDLAWSPDGSRIAFNGAGRIWIAPGDGNGPPVELQTGLPEDAQIGTFGWSPDGSRIAFRGTIGGDDELWLISDFLPEVP